jgi:hypothetical protein
VFAPAFLNPPHVHVVGKEFEARIAVEGAVILAGEMPGPVRKQALSRIRANKARANSHERQGRETLGTAWKSGRRSPSKSFFLGCARESAGQRRIPHE